MIRIKEDVKIGDIILEKGDRIKVLEAAPSGSLSFYAGKNVCIIDFPDRLYSSNSNFSYDTFLRLVDTLRDSGFLVEDRVGISKYSFVAISAHGLPLLRAFVESNRTDFNEMP